MIQTLTAPYNSRSTQRLPSFPPLGLTGITGFEGDTVVAQNTTAMKILAFDQPAFPVWVPRTREVYAWTASWKSIMNPNRINQPGDYMDLSTSGTFSEIFYSNNKGYSSAAGVPSLVEEVENGITPLLKDRWFPMMRDPACGPNPFIYVPPQWFLSATLCSQIPLSATAKTAGVIALEYWLRPGETDKVSYTLPSPGDGAIGCAKMDLLSGSTTAKAMGWWVRLAEYDLQGWNASTSGAPSNSGVIGSLFVSSTPARFAATTALASVTVSGKASDIAASVVATLPHPDLMPSNILLETPVMVDHVVPHAVVVNVHNVTKVMNVEGLVRACTLRLSGDTVFGNEGTGETPSAAWQRALPNKRCHWSAANGISFYADHGAALAELVDARYAYNRLDAGTVDAVPCMTFGPRTQVTEVVLYDGDPTTQSSYDISVSASWEFLANTPHLNMRASSFALADLEKAARHLFDRNPFAPVKQRAGVLAVTQAGGQRRRRNRPPRPQSRPEAKQSKTTEKKAAKPAPKAAKPAPNKK